MVVSTINYQLKISVLGADTQGVDPMTKLRIFVRRGALRRFHRLSRDAEGLPVSVEWDRREGDRRTDSSSDAASSQQATSAPPGTTEQRQGDRRSDPPFTWTAAEFVVVPDPPDEA